MVHKAVAPLIAVIFAAAFATALTAAPGCGRSIFPFASPSASSTSTITPGFGSFAYATNFADGTISGYSRANNGALTSLGAAFPAGAANGPMGIAITPNNNFLYVVNQGEGRVRGFEIANNGTLTGATFQSAGTNPMQVAVDPTNSFVFTTANGNGKTGGSVSAFSISSANGALTLVNTSTLPSAPIGIAVEPSTSVGNLLFVADNAQGVIYSYIYNPSTGAISQDGNPVKSLGTSLGSPLQMTFDNTGSILFVTDNTSRPNPNAALGVVDVFTINPTAVPPITFVTTTPTGTTENMPTGVVFAASSSGNLVFTANQRDNTVAVFSSQSTMLTQIFTVTGLATPIGMATDPNGQFLYVANNAANSLSLFGIFSGCGNSLCPLSPAFATGNQPEFVTITH